MLRRVKRATRRQIERVSQVALEGMDPRWSPATKIGQLDLVGDWQRDAREGIAHSLRDVGFRVFSQFEEDGLLLYVLSVIGPRSRTFVDIGSADGINSNCANLAVNHGWGGLFIDGDPVLIEHGRAFYAKHPDTWAWPPTFVQGIVKRETVNELITTGGLAGEVDLMSIDIDGNDYWVWDALEAVSPRVVIVETHVEFGTHNIVVPYDPAYMYPGRHPDYHGASPVAMAAMAATKGYRLVGSNAYGFNTIYVRDEEGLGLLPTVTAESVLAGHPRNAEQVKRLDEIRSWAYVEGGSGFPGTEAHP